jgi:hypothetical protein
MLWLNKHARLRGKLSPYIDGQLSRRDRVALEDHLAGCENCRDELADLRAAISAIGGLGDAEPPRSFALTPQMLERPSVSPPAPTPPIATGMRLAGAGVAVALAMLLIGDIGGLGGGMNGADEEGGSAATSVDERAMQFDAAGAENDSAATRAAAPAEAEVIGSSADKTEGCVPAAQMSDTGAPAGASPESNAYCAPASPSDLAAAAGDQESAEEGGEGEVSASPALDSGEDGISTLTLVEMILAGSLLALIGGIAVEYLLRRRRAH